MLSIFKKVKEVSTSKNMVSFTVTDEGIICAVLEQEGKTPKVKQCKHLSSFTDGQRARILHKFLEDQQLVGSNATYVLQPDDYRLLLIDAPDVPSNEMHAAVRWAIVDLIDFPVEEAGIDIFEAPRQAGQRAEIYVVVTRTALLQKIAQLVETAGLHLVRIDITALGLVHGLSQFYDDKKGLIFLFMRSEQSCILMMKDKDLYLERRIAVSSNNVGETASASIAEVTVETPKEQPAVENEISTEEKITEEKQSAESVSLDDQQSQASVNENIQLEKTSDESVTDIDATEKTASPKVTEEFSAEEVKPDEETVDFGIDLSTIEKAASKALNNGKLSNKSNGNNTGELSDSTTTEKNISQSQKEKSTSENDGQDNEKLSDFIASRSEQNDGKKLGD